MSLRILRSAGLRRGPAVISPWDVPVKESGHPVSGAIWPPKGVANNERKLVLHGTALPTTAKGGSLQPWRGESTRPGLIIRYEGRRRAGHAEMPPPLSHHGAVWDRT